MKSMERAKSFVVTSRSTSNHHNSRFRSCVQDVKHSLSVEAPLPQRSNSVCGPNASEHVPKMAHVVQEAMLESGNMYTRGNL